MSIDLVNNILAVDVIYQNASPYFSESFNDLLEILSLMIGEDMKIVYTFFLMLEMKCIIPNTLVFYILFHPKIRKYDENIPFTYRLNELNEITKNCEKFTTCAQVELLGDEPRNIKIQMRRISENILRADFKFSVVSLFFYVFRMSYATFLTFLFVFGCELYIRYVS